MNDCSHFVTVTLAQSSKHILKKKHCVSMCGLKSLKIVHMTTGVTHNEVWGKYGESSGAEGRARGRRAEEWRERVVIDQPYTLSIRLSNHSLL